MISKKYTLIYFLSLISLLLMSACGKPNLADKAATRTFQADNGEVKIPKVLKRVVVQNYPDEAMVLGQQVVGTDTWSYANPFFSDKEKSQLTDLGAPMNVEKLAQLAPDLIVTIDKDKVADYEKIAPTIYVDYSKLGTTQERLDYFGELFDAKKQAKNWEKNFRTQAQQDIEKLKASGLVTSDKTVAILELQAGKLYAYGDNFARGGQTLTYGLGFKQSDLMAELSKGRGYKEISLEELPTIQADYLFVDYPKSDSSQYDDLKNNPLWQANSAVKAGHVLVMPYEKIYYFAGPKATQGLLDDYTQALLDLKS